MKQVIVSSRTFNSANRIDSWYFLSPAIDASEKIEKAKSLGAKAVLLGGANGIAEEVHHPQRYTRALAAPGEHSLPYLRPYDVFHYFPEAADFIAPARTEKLSDYQLHAGEILQTRSGRNLGPAVLVDEYLARFVMSDDMIRVRISDKKKRFYVLAYLNSVTGRNLLRRDKTGSVIDHLSEQQIASQNIIFFDNAVFRQVSSRVGKAHSLRESARLGLSQDLTTYEERLPHLRRQAALRDGWTINAGTLHGRLDSAAHDPLVIRAREQLANIGGRPLSDFAEIEKPAGRYKTCYVGREHGRPLLSGTQILQSSPINLKYMAPRVFKDVTKYELREGWIAYPADGRAEEELGTPALITKDRDGWLASGHIGRIIPKKGINVGSLFLALKTEHAQIQIKSKASGSVVDSTFPDDMRDVILPPFSYASGERILQYWDDLMKAQELEQAASALIDEAVNA